MTTWTHSLSVSSPIDVSMFSLVLKRATTFTASCWACSLVGIKSPLRIHSLLSTLLMDHMTKSIMRFLKFKLNKNLPYNDRFYSHYNIISFWSFFLNNSSFKLTLNVTIDVTADVLHFKSPDVTRKVVKIFYWFRYRKISGDKKIAKRKFKISVDELKSKRYPEITNIRKWFDGIWR